MKVALKLFSLFTLLLVSAALTAQVPGQIMTDPGADDPAPGDFPEPVNGIVKKEMMNERDILEYDHVREADIMWEKTIWRVIDVREKINLPFAYPDRPFYTVLAEAAEDNKIQLYVDDDFTEVMSEDRRNSMSGTVDTVPYYDPVTYEEKFKVVVNELDPADIQRFRIKEVWFFDRESSTLKVRILGISPLKNEYDENGNFLYELPMFWVYYPGARELLATETAFAYGNDAGNRSWEDVMESRFFSSYIFQESNVYGRRIDSYLTGRDALMEADRIKREIFNFEHDLWDY
ncbi:gliding motility protein GldN [Lewinellaceae bacterium SD302]|nr:gliding motility protein GldN [Lewinellaceae bacterium SD302]